MKYLLLSLFVTLGVNSFSQSPYDYVPNQIDSRARQEWASYKWPYNSDVPRYVGLVVGWEGFRENYYQVGLVANFMEMNYAVGGLVGGKLLYQRHVRENIHRYQLELGFYNIICGGVNFNYSVQDIHSTFAVKPFIGLSLFNISVMYGYNFINKNKNQITSLRNSSFEVRYVLPLFSFSRDKKTLVEVPSGYPNQRYGRGGYSF